MEQQGSAAKVKKKVSMGVQVKRADGTIEDLGIQHQEVRELTEEELAAFVGPEEARKVFEEVE